MANVEHGPIRTGLDRLHAFAAATGMTLEEAADAMDRYNAVLASGPAAVPPRDPPDVPRGTPDRIPDRKVH